MYFYRPLNPVHAISFDLDDTLYDNRPVMLKTEQHTLLYLRQRHPAFSRMDLVDLVELRKTIRQAHPEIYHDVAEWRRFSIYLHLIQAGENPTEAERIAADTMTHFFYWRNQVDVPDATYVTLQRLADKYPLVAITNGNADPNAFGLGHYFQFVLKSGQHGRAKPYADMFEETAKRLNIEAKYILHVGDDLTTDVAGAINNQFMACWINESSCTIRHQQQTRLLPHLEIRQLAELQQLVSSETMAGYPALR